MNGYSMMAMLDIHMHEHRIPTASSHDNVKSVSQQIDRKNERTNERKTFRQMHRNVCYKNVRKVICLLVLWCEMNQSNGRSLNSKRLKIYLKCLWVNTQLVNIWIQFRAMANKKMRTKSSRRLVQIFVWLTLLSVQDYAGCRLYFNRKT